MKFFATPAEFRAWLAEHHDKEAELIVGFYKKASGKPSITYQEALDEALCFGWIDGVRHSVDEESYKQRWTPRRQGSQWSQVNLGKVERLIQEGRMHPAGMAELEKHRPAGYSFENPLELSAEYLARFTPRARAFWESQPFASYRRPAAHWVMSAKQQATRERRLKELIEDSQNGLRIKLLRR